MREEQYCIKERHQHRLVKNHEKSSKEKRKMIHGGMSTARSAEQRKDKIKIRKKNPRLMGPVQYGRVVCWEKVYRVRNMEERGGGPETSIYEGEEEETSPF